MKKGTDLSGVGAFLCASCWANNLADFKFNAQQMGAFQIVAVYVLQLKDS
ncbi:hypothetical protein AGMMS49525_17630 [Bacteroidia bacterium]|nr:hypothetical protein AGMMS49525_17630 [Bacteroidia bacterium]